MEFQKIAEMVDAVRASETRKLELLRMAEEEEQNAQKIMKQAEGLMSEKNAAKAKKENGPEIRDQYPMAFIVEHLITRAEDKTFSIRVAGPYTALELATLLDINDSTCRSKLNDLVALKVLRLHDAKGPNRRLLYCSNEPTEWSTRGERRVISELKRRKEYEREVAKNNTQTTLRLVPDPVPDPTPDPIPSYNGTTAELLSELH